MRYGCWLGIQSSYARAIPVPMARLEGSGARASKIGMPCGHLPLAISRKARSRRERARRSYRSSFSSSGSALRMASADRCGSSDGMGGTSACSDGGSPVVMAPPTCIASRGDLKSFSGSRVPNTVSRFMIATLTLRTRAISNSASAAAWACNMVMGSVKSPAI